MPKENTCCHRERKHYAKGLCRPCYQSQRRDDAERLKDRTRYASNLESRDRAKTWRSAREQRRIGIERLTADQRSDRTVRT